MGNKVSVSVKPLLVGDNRCNLYTFVLSDADGDTLEKLYNSNRELFLTFSPLKELKLYTFTVLDSLIDALLLKSSEYVTLRELRFSTPELLSRFKGLPGVSVVEVEDKLSISVGISAINRSGSIFSLVGDSFVPTNIQDSILLVTSDNKVDFYLIKDCNSSNKYQHLDNTVCLGNTDVGLENLAKLYMLYLKKFEISQETCSLSDMAKLVDLGDNKTCDLLVYDIYGGDYSQIGLPGSLTASSLGKLQMIDEVVKREDLLNSLFAMFCMNTTQHACLHVRLNNLKSILFVGELFNSIELCKKIQLLNGYWSNNAINTYFSPLANFNTIGTYLA